MFRKLVSSLPFSPALVGQLGLYARRLSREQATRRLGLIFTLLALLVQSFAILNPPEPTYAAAPSSQCTFNNALTSNDPECVPCAHNNSIWQNDPGCNKNLELTISAVNLSRDGMPLAEQTIGPNERILYTISTHNKSSEKITTNIDVSVRDVAEYATATDLGGGGYNPETQKLNWGTVTLEPGQIDLRSFIMAMNSELPVTPQATDDPRSYDCTLMATYGNTIRNAVNCPPIKSVENILRQLPTAGAWGNIAFSTVCLSAALYFYIRARQLYKEIKVIRHDYNVG